MNGKTFVLIPGFWLGAWAWDEVVPVLEAAGNNVHALTLPGLESADADRSAITFDDHVQEICRAIEAAEMPVVLVLHSGAGAPGYAASHRMPGRISSVVYVDTGPATGPPTPNLKESNGRCPNGTTSTRASMGSVRSNCPNGGSVPSPNPREQSSDRPS